MDRQRFGLEASGSVCRFARGLVAKPQIPCSLASGKNFKEDVKLLFEADRPFPELSTTMEGASKCQIVCATP